MKHAWTLAALVVATAACTDVSSGDPVGITAVAQKSSWRVDLKEARAELLAADAAHNQATATQGVPAGYTGAMAEDARFLAPAAGVIQGRSAIQAWLAAHPSYSGGKWTPESIRADVSADGQSGYTFGDGLFVRPNGTSLFLRYLSFWSKADGVWKLVASVPIGALNEAGEAPEGFGTPRDNGVRGAPSSAGLGELEAVLQADRDFAATSVAQGAEVAFRSFAAPTAALVGGPTYGPEAIGAEFVGTTGLDWGPIYGHVAESGDLGFTIGIASFPVPGGKAYTQYITVWQRQPDGRWLYVADGGTAAPPPAQ